MLDYQDFNLRPGRNYPQSELLTQRPRYRRTRLKIRQAHRCRHVGWHIAGRLRLEIQGEIEASGEPGFGLRSEPSSLVRGAESAKAVGLSFGPPDSTMRL